MIKPKYILVLFICIASIPLISQEVGERLESVEGGLEGALGDLFGGENSVKEAILNTSSEKKTSVSLEFEGYQDKSYKVAAAILNRFKKPIKEIEIIKTEIPKRSSNLELSFEFKQKSSGGYKSPYVESHFLSIIICESDDSFCDLDFGGMNILGDIYTYKLNKKWRVSGGASEMVVKVKLMPYKSAKTMKQ